MKIIPVGSMKQSKIWNYAKMYLHVKYHLLIVGKIEQKIGKLSQTVHQINNVRRLVHNGIGN